jgi:uncharacterized membrane protein
MNALAIILCIVCQLFLIVGQLFLKRAMMPAVATNRKITTIRLIPGIACMTAWFFLWLGLLEKWELSHIFPFEGLNPALMVLGAWLFLKECLSPHAWIGIALITIGIVLVV